MEIVEFVLLAGLLLTSINVKTNEFKDKGIVKYYEAE